MVLVEEVEVSSLVHTYDKDGVSPDSLFASVAEAEQVSVSPATPKGGEMLIEFTTRLVLATVAAAVAVAESPCLSVTVAVQLMIAPRASFGCTV